MSPKNTNPQKPQQQQQPTLTPAAPDPEVIAALEGEDVPDVETVTTAGDPPALDPAVPLEPFVHSAGRIVAGQPSTEDLEDLLAHFRMEPEHVASWRGKPEDRDGLVVVTVGGEKIRWPQDVEREIPRARLTGVSTSRGRVFPEGYLRRDASKDPVD